MTASRTAAALLAVSAALAVLSGCSAGAGPDFSDPQPPSREARFIDQAHDAAPATKDMPDSQVVQVGRTFCKQASLLTMDQSTTDYYIHGVSAETRKHAHHFSPDEIRRVIMDSATLCPNRMRPAMKYLRQG